MSTIYCDLIGGAVNLELPKDFVTMLNVDIGYSSRDKRVKNLSYISSDDKWLIREYREDLFGRHFEGWVEVAGE